MGVGWDICFCDFANSDWLYCSSFCNISFNCTFKVSPLELGVCVCFPHTGHSITQFAC